MKKKKTIQLGVRVDKDLMDRLDFFARNQNMDKMDYVRQAIDLYVAEMEKGYEKEAIEDYVNCRIDELKFKELMNLKEVSEDLKKARKENIEKIKSKFEKGK